MLRVRVMNEATTAKYDRIYSAIFGQLDMLRELAIAVGDTSLAEALERSQEAALARYCDAKRDNLAWQLAESAAEGARKRA